MLERKIILEMLDSLSDATLRKVWRIVVKTTQLNDKQRRFAEVEKYLLVFMKNHPRPRESDWIKFAEHLKIIGLYSHKTANWDILFRLKRLHKKYKAACE